ncbi:hypothetical protein DPMN_057483 [Dreissena polymorpha]|uniref:Uncharacterized protein n=1 Tax=Dreissena polymorpha TaxID=45954 RepID=A0A9D4HC22_DREPO|nr:hypothetical protein DPMN_057483 [Dreissena polymorpha]
MHKDSRRNRSGARRVNDDGEGMQDTDIEETMKRSSMTSVTKRVLLNQTRRKKQNLKL